MENQRLIIFALVFSLLFPVMAYGFTTFGDDIENYEITLDPNKLIMAGISFSDAQSNNLTWNGPWVYYYLQNTTIRAAWSNWDMFPPHPTINGDGIVFQKQGPIDRVFDTWTFPYYYWVRSVKTGQLFKVLENSTIISDFDNDYNWTRFELEDGFKAFFTYNITESLNMTEAVQVDGILHLTIGEGIEETEKISFKTFAAWYMGLLIGDQTYGLPGVFSWILRILTAILVIAPIVVMKEMLSL